MVMLKWLQCLATLVIGYLFWIILVGNSGLFKGAILKSLICYYLEQFIVIMCLLPPREQIVKLK